MPWLHQTADISGTGVGSGTHETRQDMRDLTLANLRAYLAGEPLLTPVPETSAG